jgi:hypothetical protein
MHESITFEVIMPLWITAPVEEVPEIVLRHWSIRQLPDGSRHFVGYNHRDREGRVSSTIVEFDVATMRGRTRSGRVYEIVGPPGRDGDAEYVWASWCRIFEVDRETVVIVSPEEIKPNNTSPATATI